MQRAIVFRKRPRQLGTDLTAIRLPPVRRTTRAFRFAPSFPRATRRGTRWFRQLRSARLTQGALIPPASRSVRRRPRNESAQHHRIAGALRVPAPTPRRQLDLRVHPLPESRMEEPDTEPSRAPAPRRRIAIYDGFQTFRRDKRWPQWIHFSHGARFYRVSRSGPAYCGVAGGREFAGEVQRAETSDGSRCDRGIMGVLSSDNAL